jgi:hypothetical protein
VTKDSVRDQRLGPCTIVSRRRKNGCAGEKRASAAAWGGGILASCPRGKRERERERGREREREKMTVLLAGLGAVVDRVRPGLLDRH